MPHHTRYEPNNQTRSKKSTSTGSGNGNRRTHHSSNVTYTPTPVSSEAAKKQKKAVGKSQLDNYKVKQVPITGIVSLAANTVTGTKLRQISFEKNRDFFRKKVLTSKNVGEYEDTLDSYKSYMKSRMSGETDAYGNPISKGGNGRPVVEKNVGGRTILAQAPTEAEVSQSDAANAAETKLTKRRVKARGRKMNIYTQSKDKLTLGKKSLLGVV